MPNLDTTNWLLGVIAFASVVQVGMLVALALAGRNLYRQLSERVEDLEADHVAPLRRQIDSILTDVQAITARFNNQSARVDLAAAFARDASHGGDTLAAHGHVAEERRVAGAVDNCAAADHQVVVLGQDQR